MKCRLVNSPIKKDFARNLLKERGVEDIEKFMHPTKELLQDWRDLENIEEACSLLLETIEGNKRILLIVDSDTDGITSAAIIYHYIMALDKDASIDYLLHSKKQHGLEDHIETILESPVVYDLIIQPDSGSNDKEYHEQLPPETKVLVLDHHITDI